LAHLDETQLIGRPAKDTAASLLFLGWSVAVQCILTACICNKTPPDWKGVVTKVPH